MGIESQKSALPTLFHFARVRAAHQPHVHLLSADQLDLQEISQFLMGHLVLRSKKKKEINTFFLIIIKIDFFVYY